MPRWLDPDEAAAAIRRGRGRGVKIAVLDSGIETTHPALHGLRLADDFEVVERDGRLTVAPGEGRDLYGHGTAIAGILHAAAPDAELGSFRVLSGSLHSRTALILEGAMQAIERGYHIINCSLGCGIKEHWDKFKAWADEAYVRGVHVIAACNNEDADVQEWPAFIPSVIGVNMARTDRDDDLFHRPGTLVEFAARGVDVEVPWSGGTIKTMTGSSFAAPRVAGMLARLISEVPDVTPLAAKALLQSIAQPAAPEFRAPNDRRTP